MGIIRSTRSSFGRAAGLGPANTGVEHWWGQRVTSVALVPLMLWFVGSIGAVGDSDYGSVIRWLASPSTTILMVLLLIALFYHAALGLQVVIEDYVHSWAKIPALMAMRFACFALVVVGLLAMARIALVG
jgi:succinate dehydrogenase / fumarate reductase membrane anchor subunit